MKKFAFLLLALTACPSGSNNTTFSVTITATNATPAEGDRVTVKANVTGGVGELTYKWEQTAPKTPKVAFSGALLQETQVTIPGLCADTDFELTVTVEDQDGKKASATTTFSVTNSNDPLELRNVTVSKTANVVVGDLLTFTAEAVGPGCGPKFQWTQPSAPATGGFEGMTNAAQTTWRAPEAPGTYNVQLILSDEGGNALPARDTMVTVQAPQYTRDIAPIFEAACTNCHGGATPDPDANANTCNGCLPFDLEGTKEEVQTELGRTPTDPACNSSPFLTAGNPAASNLWQRIELNPTTPRPAGCDQMPRNNTNFFVQNKDFYIRMKVWMATAGDPFAQ